MSEKPAYKEFHMTQAEVAEVLGESRENVALIEKAAKIKALKILEMRGLKFEDLVGSMQ
jgi:DNA-binding XRE family transcriptional regulator